MPAESAIVFHLGRGDVTPSDVIAFADGRYRAMLDPSAEYVERIERGANLAQQRAQQGGATDPKLWAATDGHGADAQMQLRQSLTRYHGCGLGGTFSDREVAAVVAARAASLGRGFSGVRHELLLLLCEMLNLRMFPRIPRRGAAGANADLVPLSYVAGAIAGDGDVSYLGRVVPAADGFAAAGLEMMELRPHEALALMSGTGMMTALGCVAWDRARHFARFASALAAMAMDVVGASVEHLDPRLDALKPHPGMRAASEWLREDMEYGRGDTARDGRPATQMLRGAGHVIGVQLDAVEFVHRVLEIELNAVSGGPIVHPASGECIAGANFYGGEVTHALDGLKSSLFTCAAYVERLLALVCESATNGGLPQDLAGNVSGATHGFHGMRGAAAGVIAEMATLAAPSALHARLAARDGSELASMGTHAARDCLEMLELAESVAAMTALGVCQAAELRDAGGLRRRSKSVYRAVRQLVPHLRADRAQDRDITSVLELFRAGLLPVGNER